VRVFCLGFLQPEGWRWFSSGKASRKGECAWLQSSTRAAGREDADYNNKQMPAVDYHTAVRADRTRGGDCQERRRRWQQDPLLETYFFSLPKQSQSLFRFLLMGLGRSAVQHPLVK